jgi:formylglycine-generating enzyme required for sulfatase activity
MSAPAGTQLTGVAPSPPSPPLSVAPSTRAAGATRWGILLALAAALGAGVFAAWPLVAPMKPRPARIDKPPAVKPPSTASSASAKQALGPCGAVAEGEACIEGTRFSRGPTDCGVQDPVHQNACPAQSVEVGTFVLDRLEVSTADWADCVKARRCKGTQATGPADAKLPVRGVTWSDAEGYCSFRKKRLPSDDEWELAAAGRAHDRVFPWGNALPKQGQAVYSRAEPLTGPEPVDAPSSETPERVLHLAGNVAEWTKTAAPSVAPWPDGVPETDGPRAWVRGGGYDSTEEWLRTYARQAYPKELASPSIGFRCARSPKP